MTQAIRRMFILTALIPILSLLIQPECLAEETVGRSKDTHSIDDFPVFNEHQNEAPTRTVEKEAQRQLENSHQNDGAETLTPEGAGRVLSTPKQKTEVSDESTEVVRDKSSVHSEVSPASNLKRPTVGLALGGGGARGAAHIGVLRVLKSSGIPIDYIVGNSMGAIVGGLYSAGVPLDDIEKILVDGSLLKSYKPGMLPQKLLISPLAKLLHPRRKHYAGLWSGKKFGKFLEKQLPANVRNVEDTIIPFSAVATNLIDGKAYRISDGELATAIRASSSIPPLLQPVAIGDKVYVDGGLRANLPASAARDTGVDIVIAVLVDEPLRVLPAKTFQHLQGIVERLSDVMLAVADARQLPFADIVINPDVSGVPVLDGTREDAEKAIRAGEAATLKALPSIKNRLLKHPARTADAQKDAKRQQ